MELAAKLFASADLSTGPAEGLAFSWWREGWVLWLQPEPRQVEEQGEWQGEHKWEHRAQWEHKAVPRALLILHQQPAPGRICSVFPDEVRALGRVVGGKLSWIFLTDSQFCD